MAWGWVQSASHEGVSSGGSIAATYASNLGTGNKLIAVVASDAAVTPSVSDGTNTFTQAVLVSGATGGAVIVGLYYLDTPAGDVGTKPTITASSLAGTTDAAILIAEVSGLKIGNTNALALDGSPATSQVTSAATVSQPAYTSTAASEFLVTINGDNGGPQTWTDPSGYQGATAGPGSAGAVTGINFNSGANVELAYKNSTNAAESGTWSFSAAGGAFTGTGFIVVAFKIAAAGGAVSPGGFTGRRAPAQPLRFRQRTFERVPPGTVTLGQYPGEFTGRHPTWPPPTRGRVRVVVPPGNQVTAPPAEFTGRHPTWPPPRRGRVFQPVPPGVQVTPSQPFSVFLTHRPLSALPLRRGKVFQPVPLGTTIVIPPPGFAHGRTNLTQNAAATRRGKQFAPPLPLVVQVPGTSVALGPPSRRFLALAQPTRGRSFVPVYPATPFTPATGIQRWLGATHIVDYTFPYPGLGSRHIGGTDYQYDGSKSD